MAISENNCTTREEKILILIPAFNEESQIAAVIQQVKQELPGIKVLVINDGSQDKTRQTALSSGASVLSHPVNMGYGVALQTGYKYALKYEYDYVLQMDGDGQHDPKYLTHLLQTAKESKVDVVVGSRVLGKQEYQRSVVRGLGMTFFGFIATLLNGQRITDSTSGYQALSRQTVEFYSGEAFPEGYPDADVLIRLRKKGLKIQEIPVVMVPNKKKQTMHSGLKPLYYTYKMLLSIALGFLRKEYSLR